MADQLVLAGRVPKTPIGSKVANTLLATLLPGNGAGAAIPAEKNTTQLHVGVETYVAIIY